MPTTVRVRLPGLPPEVPPHRRATLRSIDGRLAMTVPISDPETDFSDLGQNWGVIERAAEIAVPYRRGPRLARMTFRGQMFATDRDRHVTNEVRAIQAMCDSRSAVVLSYGELEAKLTRSGAWVIESGSVKVLQRNQGENNPRWASFELQLLEFANFEGDRWDVPLPILALPAGPWSSAQRIPSTYTWRAGDDLYSVALRVYGDPAMWTRIGDANGIRDPRAIQVGRVLALP